MAGEAQSVERLTIRDVSDCGHDDGLAFISQEILFGGWMDGWMDGWMMEGGKQM